jgi:hypothetical protein
MDQKELSMSKLNSIVVINFAISLLFSVEVVAGSVNAREIQQRNCSDYATPHDSPDSKESSRTIGENRCPCISDIKDNPNAHGSATVITYPVPPTGPVLFPD